MNKRLNKLAKFSVELCDFFAAETELVVGNDTVSDSLAIAIDMLLIAVAVALNLAVLLLAVSGRMAYNAAVKARKAFHLLRNGSEDPEVQAKVDRFKQTVEDVQYKATDLFSRIVLSVDRNFVSPIQRMLFPVEYSDIDINLIEHRDVDSEGAGGYATDTDTEES